MTLSVGSPAIAETGLVTLVEVAAAGVALVEGDTPPACRARRRARFSFALAGVEDAFDAVDHSGDGRVEQFFGDDLGEEATLVEVVGGQEPRWGSEPDGLDQGVETQIVEVLGREPTGLEVDEHLSSQVSFGLTEGEVDLAAEHDPVVQLEAKAAFGDRSPVGLEGWPAFEELDYSVVGFCSEFGPFNLGAALEPVGQAIDAFGQSSDRLVDEYERVGFAAPVDRQLDRLVCDRAAGERHRPCELVVVFGEEPFLAAHDATEEMLRYEHRVVGRQIRKHRLERIVELAPELVTECCIEARALLTGRTQLCEYLFLGWVERRRRVHASRLPHRRGRRGMPMRLTVPCHTPSAEWGSVEATSLRFAAAARSLGYAARLRSLVVPGFRSPPGLEGVHRTIRRRSGVPTVAVALKGRPWSAVVSDMIEGVVVANGLSGAKADRARAALWLAVDDSGELAAA